MTEDAPPNSPRRAISTLRPHRGGGGRRRCRGGDGGEQQLLLLAAARASLMGMCVVRVSVCVSLLCDLRSTHTAALRRERRDATRRSSVHAIIPLERPPRVSPQNGVSLPPPRGTHPHRDKRESAPTTATFRRRSSPSESLIAKGRRSGGRRRARQIALKDRRTTLLIHPSPLCYALSPPPLPPPRSQSLLCSPSFPSSPPPFLHPPPSPPPLELPPPDSFVSLAADLTAQFWDPVPQPPTA